MAFARLCESDGYKLCGVHRDLATPETTWEVPASEGSYFRDHRQWLRTATNSKECRKTD
ncbi:unnamed protein product [Eruca vesicaria subsp. sativa]|uniref:Uncharacterized protein n=1 Tax=Eruca vesicaria subsp. sativa TaxID=29727 RepID=A0ABC8LLB4_ERUVS|nr:unnamed protein product [Eruca vesicaria subsp. sativa]